MNRKTGMEVKLNSIRLLVGGYEPPALPQLLHGPEVLAEMIEKTTDLSIQSRFWRNDLRRIGDTSFGRPKE